MVNYSVSCFDQFRILYSDFQRVIWSSKFELHIWLVKRRVTKCNYSIQSSWLRSFCDFYAKILRKMRKKFHFAMISRTENKNEVEMFSFMSV